MDWVSIVKGLALVLGIVAFAAAAVIAFLLWLVSDIDRDEAKGFRWWTGE